ncbi:hypothetical protein IEE_05220 [Bacillus cereus BAG5X1-1]|uniref:Uncharacterized protein n=1 Tax=Bacillus cereus BAG5X1-1 TaxID=1053189 RepID=J8AFN8_BACCE|nr:hypothetical protein [Bacillus cereus]EJQ37434.1 hypothetical protein IEE_05220 [Bacillus cereus BAG5X1-1]
MNNALIQKTSVYNDDIWQAEKYIFKFKSYKKDYLQVEYSITVLISKLALVFYLQHKFSVDCPNDTSFMSTLDGDSTQAYTIQQLELEQQVIQSLTWENYIQLSYAEVKEIVMNLKFPGGVTFFGPQLTVEYAVFHDVLNLCPE